MSALEIFRLLPRRADEGSEDLALEKATISYT
jgi:hypothetical protein